MSNIDLEARAAVQDVMLRYAIALDTCDMPAYCALFTEDAVISGFTPSPVCGPQDLGACVKKAMAQFSATQHLMSPPLVRVTGDTAHAQTPVQAIHFFKDRDKGNFTLWGTYETDLVRIGGVWKIRNHALVTLANNMPRTNAERWAHAGR